MQSGKPVGVFRTHADAPRVLIANSNLVPHWATWDHFNELDRKGLMMYGQMTAGSWIYIGTQGIVQGTYETFVEVGRQHYGGDLAGRWILTAGLGGMGGAQPLAATMAGASLPGRRMPALPHRDAAARPATSTAKRTASTRRSRSSSAPAASGSRSRSACSATPPRSARAGAPRHAARRGDRPDLGARSAQRLSARGLDARRMGAATRERSRRASSARRRHRWPCMCARCSTSSSAACRPSTTATTSARWRRTRASPTPSTSPASCRPISARCSAAASARSAGSRSPAIPRTSYRTDAKVKELMPDDRHLHHWLDMARQRIKFQGLPARICWVGLGDRHRLGLAFNEMVARGELKAPIVIGRDHLDSGSVASPNRETEAMQDGSDAVSDWPLLNALLNCASGATWVSLHHGGGVGMGFSQHAGMVIVCRRHAGGGAADRARAVERPGDRRHAPRRRRLRRSDRLCEGLRA